MVIVRLKGMKYYVFRRHLLIDRSGVILESNIAAVNIDELEMLLELSGKNGLKTLGDKVVSAQNRYKMS